MGIISWIILGLIVGILAKWFMPGKDGGGFFMTVILGDCRCVSRWLHQRILRLGYSHRL